MYAILTPVFFLLGYGYGAELSDGDLTSIFNPVILIIGILVMIGMYYLSSKVFSFYFDMLMHRIVNTLQHLQKELNSKDMLQEEP